MADTELIVKIIKAVKQRDCLWNVHSSEYAKRDKLEKAWQEVAVDVGRAGIYNLHTYICIGMVMSSDMTWSCCNYIVDVMV